MLRTLLVFCLALLLGSSLHAQPPVRERYQLVCITSPTPKQLSLLASLDNDHAHWTSRGMEAALTNGDVERLREAGANVTVLVDDLERFYSDRAAISLEAMKKNGSSHLLSRPSASVANFQLGSVGGYFSLPELSDQLAKMATLYPSLASTPFSIGTTTEGREILAIRISARPESDESVPEVLYDALHHAREPAGMMSLIYTMWSLLEGYGNDPQMTYLLDHRALYFVPIVNPDGYQENIRIYPSGGGLWRRNMRASGDSGVDLNRNYGPYEYWNAPNAGSSESAKDQNYRGPAPFSEPETRAMRDFCLAHRFRVALNHHTYSNLMIYPFDWKTRTPEDSNYYRVASRELAFDNGFACGTGPETVGYPARGVSDEWMYDFGGKGEKIISWSPESGSEVDGFWPAPDRVTPMAETNHPMNVMLAWLAGSYPRVTAVERIDAGATGMLRVTVTNLGREAMDGDATVSIQGAESDAIGFPPLKTLETRTIDLPIPAGLAMGKEARPEISLIVRYHDVPLVRTLRPMVHPLTPVFADDFEGSLAGWSLGDWAAETVPGRGRVLSDSPYDNYIESDLTNVLQSRKPISLQGFDAAELLFDASFAIEARDHKAVLEARRDGTSDWHPIGCEYLQVPLLKDGPVRNQMRGDQKSWQRYSVNLDEFAGSDVYLRLSVETPRSGYDATFNGVLLDNLVVVASKPVTLEVSHDQDDGMLRLTVFPNPFADRITVRLDGSSQNVEYRLVNALGQVVRTGGGEASAVIDAEGLPGGFYMLVVTSGGLTLRESLMLRR